MRCGRRCANPEIAVVLLDLVIGYGAHANPAAHLAGIVAGRAADAPILVASVTGTELDRQVRSAQISVAGTGRHRGGAVERAGLRTRARAFRQRRQDAALCEHLTRSRVGS